MRKTAIVLAAALLAGVVFGADGPPVGPKDVKPGKIIAAAGVLADNKADFVMLWVDGDEAPTKFMLADTFDKNTFGFPPKCKGVFGPDRVQFTYTKGDAGNTVLAMQRDKTPMQGTVTGEVQFSNDFWVAVKPKNGPLDGYAISWPPGPMVEKLKALQKGDWVTIKFHTDVERHRIETLAVVPKPAAPATPAEKPAPGISKTPTSRPEAATSQPSVTNQAGDKLKLAEMYIDNGMKDKAKEMLENIIRLYPDTEAAKTAKTKLTELGG